MTTKPVENAPRLAYTKHEAADIAGVSYRTIEDAIRSGELEARYPHRRPIIKHSALIEWLDSLPTESPLTR